MFNVQKCVFGVLGYLKQGFNLGIIGIFLT